MLSLVIPAFSVSMELKNITLNCIESFRPYVDEVIVSDDSDIYWRDLHHASDQYLLHPRMGYTKNLNMGWRLARGEYVLHASGDCRLIAGNPLDLCIPNTVTSPRVQAVESDPPRGNLSGACFLAPKSVTDKIGMMDVGVDWNNNPDLEYFGRLKNHSIPTVVIQDVIVSHAAASPGPFVLSKDMYKGR